MIKTCAFCEAEFKAKPSNKRQCCSRDCSCKARKAKNQFQCSYCQQTYYRSPAHQARVKKAFCSKKCMGMGERGEANHAWRGGLIDKECLECKTLFSVKQSQEEAKCCSTECKHKFYSKNPRRPLVEILCEECQSTIKVKDTPTSRRKKYCSIECKDKAHAKRMLGENNGRYIHGECTKPYRSYFGRKLRKTIRDRDGDCCKLCGMTKEQHGKNLDVHHVNYNKEDFSESNLICLCRYCHGKMHGSSEKRKEWSEKLSNLLKE